MCGRSSPAQVANASSRRLPRHGRSSAVCLVRICWRMCWSQRSVITCRFIVSLRCMPAKVLISIARRSPVGLARPASCLPRWSMRSGSMCWQRPRFMPMTRRFRCLHPATARPGPAGLWTYVRNDRPAGYPTPAAVWFAYSENRKGEHPRRHLKGFKGALQADAYSGLHHLYDDGNIYEVSCWSHARRKFHDIHVVHARRRPAKRLLASGRCTKSSKKSVASLPISAVLCARLGRSHCLMIFTAGWKRRCIRYRRKARPPCFARTIRSRFLELAEWRLPF
jgi:hypothetical protein